MLRCPWCIGRLATRIKERLRGIFERLIDKHHSAIGVLVKEQKDRLTDEQLVAMIRDRVGDDLDWIRINGTLVGGTIGRVIFLANRTQAMNLGGGCTLYVSGFVLPFLTATNSSGFASVKLSIPRDPSLHGGAAYAQAFVSDPQGAFAGLAVSAGLKLVLGD